MTPYYARLVLGWTAGTSVEQHLLAVMREGTWADLQRMARGWPDLVDVFLLYQDHPEQVAELARRVR